MDDTFFADYTNLLSSIDVIAKTKEGYGYTYLELTPLLDVVMPKIRENNFVLFQTVKKSDGAYIRDTHDKDGSKHIETPAFVLHSELIHKGGQKIECDMPLYVDDIDPQAIGSAETYMRRYSIYCLLNIKVKDNDGLDASTRGKQNKRDQESRLPLPENAEEIAGFLANQEKPQIYYKEIKKLFESSAIDGKLWAGLKKIMYPN